MVIATISLLFAQSAKSQNEKMQAFDAALQLNMSDHAHQDLSTSISFGVSGRRIPISLLVGFNYMEFEDDFQKLGYKHPTTVGFNATGMVRLYYIEFRSMDLNAYTTVYRQGNGKYLSEIGGRIGALINDRSRFYLFAGDIFNKQYGSVSVGAGITLFFFNGYDGYTLGKSKKYY